MNFRNAMRLLLLFSFVVDARLANAQPLVQRAPEYWFTQTLASPLAQAQFPRCLLSKKYRVQRIREWRLFCEHTFFDVMNGTTWVIGRVRLFCEHRFFDAINGVAWVIGKFMGVQALLASTSSDVKETPAIVRLFLVLYLRDVDPHVQVEGLEHLSQNDAYLIAMNHGYKNAIDVFVVAFLIAAKTGRVPHMLITKAKKSWKLNLLRRMLEYYGLAKLVEAKNEETPTRSTDLTDEMAKDLQKNPRRVYVICPKGEAVEDLQEQMQGWRTGAVTTALKSRKVIIPAAFRSEGTDWKWDHFVLLRAGRKALRKPDSLNPFKIYVRFGTPIEPVGKHSAVQNRLQQDVQTLMRGMPNLRWGEQSVRSADRKRNPKISQNVRSLAEKHVHSFDLLKEVGAQQASAKELVDLNTLLYLPYAGVMVYRDAAGHASLREPLIFKIIHRSDGPVIVALFKDEIISTWDPTWDPINRLIGLNIHDFQRISPDHVGILIDGLLTTMWQESLPSTHPLSNDSPDELAEVAQDINAFFAINQHEKAGDSQSIHSAWIAGFIAVWATFNLEIFRDIGSTELLAFLTTGAMAAIYYLLGRSTAPSSHRKAKTST